MGRLFSALFCLLILSAMLFGCPSGREDTQEVFFSMIFPQLIPDFEREAMPFATPDEALSDEAAPGEAVLL